MKKIQSIILALSTCVAAPSYAADLIIEAPAIIESDAYDWSGFYAGVLGGGGAGTAISTNTISGNSSGIGVSGGLLGGNVGYNHQVDNYILGAEGELLWSSVTGSALCSNPVFTCSGTVNWLTSAKVRAGVAYDAMLLYGNLGVAAGGFSSSTTPAVNGTTGNFSGIGLGWTAGAGLEFGISEAVTLRAEYAYYSLGANAPTNTLNDTPIDLRGNIHTTKVGLNFRF